MHSNIAVTKKMVEYAKKHGLAIPQVSLTNPIWGNGKKTLAWRVSGHLRNVPQSTAKTEALDRALFPLTLSQRIVIAAQAELGVKENPAGSNDGPRVRDYQESTGMYKQPWCASFVTFIYQKCGIKLPAFNHAYVPSWAANKDNGILRSVTRTELKPGDAVCLWHNGHIEIFEKWIVKGVLAQCIGGNTAPVGRDNNGGMVARTKRYTYEMSAQIRPY